MGISALEMEVSTIKVLFRVENQYLAYSTLEPVESVAFIGDGGGVDWTA